MDIAKYPLIESEILNELIDAIYDKDLRYRCSDLFQAGIVDEKIMANALKETMHTLKTSGLVPQHYMQRNFVTDIASGEVFFDWRLSKSAFLLTLLHAAGENQILYKWKKQIIELLK